MTNYFRIRNFERFQHYKDRNPPWIRLYGGLWRDRAFFRLPDAVKAHLIGLFALAARLDNRIPDDAEWLAHELCASQPIDLAALLASGFLVPEHPASASDAACEPADTPSVSGSDLLCINRDTEDISDKAPSTADLCERPDGKDASNAASDEAAERVATSQRRNKRPEVGWPAGFALDDEMRQFAMRLQIDPELEFEAWRDDCGAHDRRYADWRAAWRGRCRNALRFGRRNQATARASPGESAIDMALRRLREAREREQSGEVNDRS